MTARCAFVHAVYVEAKKSLQLPAKLIGSTINGPKRRAIVCRLYKVKRRAV